MLFPHNLTHHILMKKHRIITHHTKQTTVIQAHPIQQKVAAAECHQQQAKVLAFSNASVPALASAESRPLPPHFLHINPVGVILHCDASLCIPQQPAWIGSDPLEWILFCHQHCPAANQTGGYRVRKINVSFFTLMVLYILCQLNSSTQTMSWLILYSPDWTWHCSWCHDTASNKVEKETWPQGKKKWSSHFYVDATLKN